MANVNTNAVDPVAAAELAAMRAKLDAAEKALAELKAKGGGGRITLKVSEKGALSAYGMGRFPITLYASQWEKLLGFAQAAKGNPIEAFIAEQGSKLSRKD